MKEEERKNLIKNGESPFKTLKYDLESAPLRDVSPNNQELVMGKERQALPSVLTFKEKLKLKSMVDAELK